MTRHSRIRTRSCQTALLLNRGEPVTTAEIWYEQRRPEIVQDFESEVYGCVPDHVPQSRGPLRARVNRPWARYPSGKGAGRNRRQFACPVHRSQDSDDGGDATERCRSCATAHDVRKDRVPRRTRCTPTAAGQRAALRSRPVSRPCSVANATADRSRLGLRHDRSGEHPGGQRRRPDARHHRAGQPRPTP